MILAKTELGQQAFKDRAGGLKPRQRSAFILFDGVRSVGEVLDAGMGITMDEIQQMIADGYLAPGGIVAPAKAADPTDATDGDAFTAPRSTQQRYQDAYQVAIRLTGGLGLRGFRLNMAVEGARSYEDLLALAPRIRAAVGDARAAELDRALGI